MSEYLIDQPALLQLVLPVAGAVLFVAAVYAFSVRRSSPNPPILHLWDDSPKKQRQKAAVKKKQKTNKKEKVSNGQLVPETVTKLTKATDATKPAVKKRVQDVQVSKNAQDTKKQKIADRIEMEKNERALMRKEAARGGWVTVALKDKKLSKSSSPSKNNVEDKETKPVTEDIAVAPISTKKSLKKDKNSDKESQSTISVDNISNGAVTEGAKPVQSESVKPAKVAMDFKGNEISAQAKSSKKKAIYDPHQKVVKPLEPVKKLAETQVNEIPAKDADIKSDVIEAADPAFDEMHDWEEAKPLKLKKRARRER